MVSAKTCVGRQAEEEKKSYSEQNFSNRYTMSTEQCAMEDNRERPPGVIWLHGSK